MRVGGTQDVFYRRDSIVPLPLIERAEGVYMWDEDGKEYIDASSGPMVSALGHGHPAVVAAIAAQASRLDYAYTRGAEPPEPCEREPLLARGPWLRARVSHLGRQRGGRRCA
jgi:4-aminobutyrate aminotransferase-like enzyme